VYCTLTEGFLNLTEVFLTLTEVFPCFFLSCKANARIKPAKTGHGPHSSTLVVICVVRLLFVLFYALFVCKCVLSPGDNPIAVNKYIIKNNWKGRTCCNEPITISTSFLYDQYQPCVLYLVSFLTLSSPHKSSSSSKCSLFIYSNPPSTCEIYKSDSIAIILMIARTNTHSCGQTQGVM